MPAELLRDVSRPPREASGRRFSMLPLSIAAHAAAGLAIVIIPLAAEVELPTPARLSGPAFVKAQPLPPPPARAISPTTKPVSTGAAPLDAPPTIADEVPSPPSSPSYPGIPDGGVVVPGNVPGGIDTLDVPVPAPPPPPPGQPTLIRPGGQVREPKRTVNVAPVYPVMARNAHVEGTVILEAIINESGGVERVKVLRSVALLDGAAIDAVKQWRYTPTLLNGTPVSVLMTITVRFTLSER